VVSAGGIQVAPLFAAQRFPAFAARTADRKSACPSERPHEHPINVKVSRMSNTTITPPAAGATVAGVALAMGLALAPVQAEAALNDVGATATAVSPIAPPFNGQPVSWRVVSSCVSERIARPA
jgi:hypothetical protein